MTRGTDEGVLVLAVCRANSPGIRMVEPIGKLIAYCSALGNLGLNINNVLLPIYLKPRGLLAHAKGPWKQAFRNRRSRKFVVKKIPDK